MKLRNLTTIGARTLLVAWLSGCSTLGRPARPARGIARDGPDAEVRDFRIGALRARLETMPPGVEREYFSGILASRSGRVEDAIRLLNRVLPELRTAHRQRAATALQALAETYLLSYHDFARSAGVVETASA